MHAECSSDLLYQLYLTCAIQTIAVVSLIRVFRNLWEQL